MCENCDEVIELNKNEIRILLDGGTLPGMDEDYTEANIMGMIACRAAVVIQHSEGPMKGEPISMIIGMLAGVALEAEMLTLMLNQREHEMRVSKIAKDN